MREKKLDLKRNDCDIGGDLLPPSQQKWTDGSPGVTPDRFAQSVPAAVSLFVQSWARFPIVLSPRALTTSCLPCCLSQAAFFASDVGDGSRVYDRSVWEAAGEVGPARSFAARLAMSPLTMMASLCPPGGTHGGCWRLGCPVCIGNDFPEGMAHPPLSSRRFFFFFSSLVSSHQFAFRLFGQHCLPIPLVEKACLGGFVLW